MMTRLGKELSLDLGNGVSIKLVLIPAGKFLMGSPKDEKERQDNEGLPPGQWENGNPQITVTISKPFYMGVYEVTVDQYARFVKGTGQRHKKPEEFDQTGDHPVVKVSWDDAQAFCQWLSKKTGKTVVLPTEAQWEYACRAGTVTPFHTGETISPEQANYHGDHVYGNGKRGIYREKTTPVGSFQPNAWGLYDMHGNVWEWCQDRYGDYGKRATTDPTGVDAGSLRVLRGGSWNGDPADCRSAFRYWDYHGDRIDSDSFRVVVVADVD